MSRRPSSRQRARASTPGRRLAAVLIPAALAVVLVLPVFPLGYLFDDYDFLGRSQTFRLANLLPDSATLFYRPVSRDLYFGLLYLLGPNQAFWGHLGNAVLLALATALLGWLTGKLAGARAGFFAGAAFASLGSIPVLVGWVSGAQDLLAIVFVLTALHLALERQTGLALVAAALALLSKETSVAFLAAMALLPSLAGRKQGDDRAAWIGFGALAVVWGAIHPGIRQLLGHRFESGESHTAYLTLTGADAWKSAAKTLVSVANAPVAGAGSPWPPELNAVFAVGAVALAASAWAVAPRSERRAPGPSGASVPIGRLALLALLLTIAEVAVSSLLVRQWELYYTPMAALGTSMLLGAALARLPRLPAAAGAVAFLALGFWCRGMDLGSSIPTERNMRAPSGRLARVRAEFRKIVPSLRGPSHVYASVDASGSQDIYVHLFRFQALRVWYRNHAIDTMHPEWRRPNPVSEHLVWVGDDLSVNEVDTHTLRIRSSASGPDSSRYNDALRSYAQGLAASGAADRAVTILVAMREPNEYAKAYDLRLAAALLLAEGRDQDAVRLLQGLPEFSRQDAIEAACEILVNPSRRDIDVPVMQAMGLSPGDPDAVRSMMRWFAMNRSMAATIRFANRLRALAPQDSEAATVLRWLGTAPEQKRATVPVAPDSLW